MTNAMNPADSQKFLIEQKHLQKVNLPPTKKLRTTGPVDPDSDKSNYRKKLVKRIWNSYGGLLEALSKILKIDPAVAVAVLCVESGGKGFAPDGRMIIRFENHIFWRYWGNSHASLFNHHFKFGSNKPWLAHKFRKDPKGDWRSFHQKGQAGEWEAFEFARLKHQRFAMYSISMGLPQIMGFNHKRIGYKSVKRMFDLFASSRRNQIMGLFDFIGGKSSDMGKALRKKDFLSFAERYNGSGKAVDYADLIEAYYDTFKGIT